MGTDVSAQIRWVADQYVHGCGYASAVLSGIMPNAAHLSSGGYHCSVLDLRRYGNQGDYSNSRPDDKDFNVGYGAAIDISMNKSDMMLHHRRLYAAYKDMSDPRRQYFNCVNTWDGSGDAVRLDFVANVEKYASADHQWHSHSETRRRWLLDDKAARGQVSVVKGESKVDWLAREDPQHQPAPPPAGPPAWPVGPDDYFLPRNNAPFYETVRRWEEQMRKRGWPIPVDGRLSLADGKILLAFQQEKGLGADGKLGPRSFAAAWTAKIT